MTRRSRFVLTLLAATLGQCTLGAPLPADAAIARPTNLRPVQSKADCAAALSLAAFVCDAAVGTGALQLIWDESDKTVAGYQVYLAERTGHKLLGTSTGTARYYLVKRPSTGYANLCFAVAAYAGSQTSGDSSRYCYAPGATATTRSFKPSHAVTKVTAGTSYHLNCSNAYPLPSFAYFKAANSHFGSAFTTFFPWLTSEKPQSGRGGVSGVYAGNETAVWPLCKGAGENAYAQINALGVAVFDLDLGALAKHKLYSATLTLKPSQTVGLASGKAKLSSGRWCQAYVGGNGDLTNPFIPSAFGQSTVVPREASIDVISIVSAWVQYGINYGFLVGTPSPSEPYGFPTASSACLTKFSTPSLQVVYF